MWKTKFGEESAVANRRCTSMKWIINDFHRFRRRTSSHVSSEFSNFPLFIWCIHETSEDFLDRVNRLGKPILMLQRVYVGLVLSEGGGVYFFPAFVNLSSVAEKTANKCLSINISAPKFFCRIDELQLEWEGYSKSRLWWLCRQLLTVKTSGSIFNIDFAMRDIFPAPHPLQRD